MRELHLNQNLFLVVYGVFLLPAAEDGLADLYDLALGLYRCFRFCLLLLWNNYRVSGFWSLSTCKVSLMLLALSVSHETSPIGVMAGTETTLKRSDMIPEEVRILGNVDGLKGQSPELLPPLNVCVLKARYFSAARPPSRAVLPFDHLAPKGTHTPNTGVDH